MTTKRYFTMDCDYIGLWEEVPGPEGVGEEDGVTILLEVIELPDRLSLEVVKHGPSVKLEVSLPLPAALKAMLNLLVDLEAPR